MRSLAESEPRPLTENFAIKESITAGEMVSKESLDKLLHTNILQLLNKKGIIIDGFPRDMNQIRGFQEKASLSVFFFGVSMNNNLFYVLIFQYNQIPPVVLLDCSKLQLGRGRLDDSVSSFRRRLELFRELTLPMLKSMDADGHLTIVSFSLQYFMTFIRFLMCSNNLTSLTFLKFQLHFVSTVLFTL